MRLIAQRLLPSSSLASKETYVDRELIVQQRSPLLPPEPGHTHHIYCSEFNAGAAALLHEAKGPCRLMVRQDEGAAPPRGARLSSRRGGADKAVKEDVLYVTTEKAYLETCDHMMLYLTSLTWTSGEATDRLAAELLEAMDLEVHVLLVHEMPGMGGQEARSGCEFGQFFSCEDGATPNELLRKGIYSEIAVPLKGGPWREASMSILAKTLASSVGEGSVRMDEPSVFQRLRQRPPAFVERARALWQKNPPEVGNRPVSVKRHGKGLPMKHEGSMSDVEQPASSVSVTSAAAIAHSDIVAVTLSKEP